MVKEVPEPILTDKTHADMFVPVKPASPFAFRVIQMDDSEIFRTNLLIELRKCVCDTGFSPKFISCGKCMTGIKTDTGT
jgi:hypothetical protein